MSRRESLSLNLAKVLSPMNATPAQAAKRRAMNRANAKLRRELNLLKQEKAHTAAQAKNNLKESIHKVLNLTTLAHQNQYRPVVNKVLNFVSAGSNSPNLQNKATALLAAYEAIPGNGHMNQRTKIRILNKLVELMDIYSKSHGKAFYNAALNRGLGRFRMLAPAVKYVAKRYGR